MYKSLISLACLVAFARAGTIGTTIGDSVKNASDSAITLVSGLVDGAITTGQDAIDATISMGNTSANSLINMAEQGIQDVGLTALTAMDNANDTMYKMADTVSAIPILAPFAQAGASIGGGMLQGLGSAALTAGGMMGNVLEAKRSFVNTASNATTDIVGAMSDGMKAGSTGMASIGKGWNKLASSTFGNLFPW